MKVFGNKKNDKELARIYIVYQKANRIFPAAEALNKGTVFPELYRPYKIKKG
ncbi:spore coat associated protein CotJA [Clostridium sp. 'deep sea']|uniref:spore coat associated protein CotJA n=1 Tax=Clostridium sp. 'deep sea' TaxID=2779445 RepID=UPI00189687AC|nr:spore coat associated protein CotJA [Clostridium sp. 'deep sea']QOR34357.1 spore coat associated protein CotJA [Clostridium sp. 'deep sea']